MRTSYSGSFLFNDNGLIAVNLGSDYCGEHEWGIKDIKRDFGISDDGFGKEKREITKISNRLNLFDKDDLFGIINYNFYDKNDLNVWLKNQYFYNSSKNKDFCAAWSSQGFYIAVNKEKLKGKVSAKDKKKYQENFEKTKEHIKHIYNALMNNNAVIWLGGGGVFENAGLCIGISDKMPNEIFDNWYKLDKNDFDLKNEFNETGIEELLRNAGKEWFALSPSKNTGKLQVWLNPYHQKVDNFGWFTIEELKQWAKDEGPIPMKNNKK